MLGRKKRRAPAHDNWTEAFWLFGFLAFWVFPFRMQEFLQRTGDRQSSSHCSHRRFSQRLHALYERRPLLMNSIVGGLVYVVGEIIVQLQNVDSRVSLTPNYPSNVTQINIVATNKFENSKQNKPTIAYLNCVLERNTRIFTLDRFDLIDWHRVLHIGALGVVENGVLMLLWYRLLAKVVGNNVRTLTVIVKCILDQIFFASQQDAIFLGYCGYLHNNTWQAAFEEVKKQFITTWLNDCSLWPIVNFIGFAYVPTFLQPTYMSCVQLFWQIYISSVAAPNKLDEGARDMGEGHMVTIPFTPAPIAEQDAKSHRTLRKGLMHVSERVKTMEDSNPYPHNPSNPPVWSIADQKAREEALGHAKVSGVVMTGLVCLRSILHRI
eukprot:gene30014-36250_t